MKLLAFDLDGTLVTKDRRLPEPIKAAVARAEAAGHAVTVITGRAEISARPFLEALGISRHYGTYHGARVATPDGAVLFEARLTPEIVRGILERHGSAARSYFLSTGEHFYVDEPEGEDWDWARQVGHNVTAYRAYGGEPANALFFYGEDTGGLHTAIEAAHPELRFYPWAEGYLEVTANGAHKGEALRRIAAELGFAREDVVAFGDGINDVTMLEWAGWGVAVGDAHPKVLAVADEHIPAPEENGVALWLERTLLAAPEPVGSAAG